MRGALEFEHVTIDTNPPGSHHDVLLLADLTGNGLPDIIIGCKEGPVNLFWYENPGWARHDIAEAPNLEAGGALVDITGNGRLDIVVGQQAGGRYLLWFEQPENPRQPWTRRVIEDRFEKYHDQAVGDVDGDGEHEIVAISQKCGVVMYYDIPADPRVEPWPRGCCHIIARNMQDVEGLAVCDLDGDGRAEIIAGPHVLKPSGAQLWDVDVIATDYVMTRVAVADLDCDGRLEVVLCEGESHPGRLAWFSGPPWREHLLRDDLFHPHSLQIADFNADGLPDIFVAEMGLGRNQNPRMFIYLNQGDGRFEEVLVWQGIPTHEAKVADLTGNGLPDIVGKPYVPEKRIDAWLNRSG